jgi:hypothetical protein
MVGTFISRVYGAIRPLVSAHQIRPISIYMLICYLIQKISDCTCACYQLPIGAGQAVPTGEDPSNYAFLCPDATKKPITGKPCIWAARPWQGYVTNGDLDR